MYKMMFYTFFAALLTMAATAEKYTTPVPILKQINKHNEDGSYSYGYEAADGSYKIESKYPNGEVYGKYGYVDDQGKLREIEYGASRRGFEPAGSEVNVAPPTLKNNYQQERPLAPNEEDDGQYREDPSVYYADEQSNRSPQPTYSSRYTQPAYQQQQYQQPQYEEPQYEEPKYEQPRYQEPRYQQPQYQQPQYQQTQYQQPKYQPQTTYQQQSYQKPAFRPQTSFSSFGFNSQPKYQAPAAPAYNNNYNQFSGNPATNVDYNSGSYSVQY